MAARVTALPAASGLRSYHCSVRADRSDAVAMAVPATVRLLPYHADATKLWRKKASAPVAFADHVPSVTITDALRSSLWCWNPMDMAMSVPLREAADADTLVKDTADDWSGL